MTIQVVLVATLLAAFAGPAPAQQAADAAEQDVTPPASAAPEADLASQPAQGSDAASAGEAKVAAEKAQRADNEALLRAQSAGYKLVNKDGKQVFCKKEMVTGSRLATRTRCLTLAQIEAERNATKDMLNDLSRKAVNIPEP